MKKITLLLSLFLLVSCDYEDFVIKKIIHDQPFSYYSTFKISDIDIIKEDFFNLAVHYSLVEKHIDIDSKNNFYVCRYIFKTDRGLYRNFYLIDYDNEKVVKSSNDYNDFFVPIANEVFGGALDDLQGDRLVDLWSYY